ncbi:MAG: hypothetical protein AAB553_05585 [Patescibacteria group bacterium]
MEKVPSPIHKGIKVLQRATKAKITPFFILAIFGVLTVLTVGVAQQRQEVRQQAANPQMVSEEDIDKYFQCLSLGGTCSEEVARALKAVPPDPCVTLAGPKDPEALLPELGPITFKPQTVQQGEILKATGRFIIDKEIPECANGTHAELPSYTVLAIHDETGERVLFPTKTVPFTLIGDGVRPGDTSKNDSTFHFPPLAAAANENSEDLALEMQIPDEMPTGNYTGYLIPATDQTLESISIDGARAIGEFTVEDPCLASLRVAFTLEGQTENITVHPDQDVTFSAGLTGDCEPGRTETVTIIGSDPNGELITYGEQNNVGLPGTVNIGYKVPANAMTGIWKAGITIGDSDEFNASLIINFTVAREGGTFGERNVGDSCTQNANDFQGGCQAGLICNTWRDVTCPEGNCTGTCQALEEQVCRDFFEEVSGEENTCRDVDRNDVLGRLGKPCRTEPNTAGFDGVHGNCYDGVVSDEVPGREMICYTAPDPSLNCKNNGSCAGTCRVAYPGFLPDDPCTRTSEADWQGGCVNGQFCSTVTNTCKGGGFATAQQEATEQGRTIQLRGQQEEPQVNQNNLPLGSSCTADTQCQNALKCLNVDVSATAQNPGTCQEVRYPLGGRCTSNGQCQDNLTCLNVDVPATIQNPGTCQRLGN